MAYFEKAIPYVLANEGGYSKDPLDPGGETIYGIARKKNPTWDGWPLVDNFKKDAKNFPQNALADSSILSRRNKFYKLRYWDVNRLDQLDNQDIATEMLDTGVNLGPGKAASFLIMALNILNRQQRDYTDVPEDGRIDPGDIALVNAHKRPQNILKALNGLQFMHYFTITKTKPAFEKYFNGWLNRV